MASPMTRLSRLTAFLGLAILACCVSACSLNERIHNMGPEVTADLVVYFKADVTPEQIESFWNRELSYSAPDGHQSLRSGVGRLSRVESVEGHEGIAIIFFWQAWNSERAQLRRDIDASLLVFAVLENIAPQDVKSLKR
jgi:hypothetical protein